MTGPIWRNRNVWGMTVTSFLSDACYEMVLAVLPGFLPLIGAGAATLGWIEGISDAFASFLKLGAGWYSDRIGHRKRMVVAGYFLTGTGLSFFSVAYGWPVILLGRVVSWFGKGLRGTLRDAMLAESVDPVVRGKAFGFHRAGDTLGAIVGPLCGAALIAWLPHVRPDGPFRTVFLLSLIPGLAAPLAFAFMVRETARQPARKSLWGAVRGLPQPYFRFLLGVGVFGAGDFSPTLLVLSAATLLAPAMGPVKAAQIAALLYVGRNVIYAATCYPVGALSDLRASRKLLAGGFLIGAAAAALAAALFAQHSGSLAILAVVFALSGILAAVQDTLAGAIPAGLLPADARGSGFGLLGAVTGAGDLISSALVGTLWSLGSPATAFGVAAGLMALGSALTARDSGPAPRPTNTLQSQSPR